MNPEEMLERAELYDELFMRAILALERIANALEQMVPPKKVGLFEYLTGNPLFGPPSDS